jgi:hypothetical protein
MLEKANSVRLLSASCSGALRERFSSDSAIFAEKEEVIMRALTFFWVMVIILISPVVIYGVRSCQEAKLREAAIEMAAEISAIQEAVEGCLEELRVTKQAKQPGGDWVGCFRIVLGETSTPEEFIEGAMNNSPGEGWGPKEWCMRATIPLQDPSSAFATICIRWSENE